MILKCHGAKKHFQYSPASLVGTYRVQECRYGGCPSAVYLLMVFAVAMHCTRVLQEPILDWDGQLGFSPSATYDYTGPKPTFKTLVCHISFFRRDAHNYARATDISAVSSNDSSQVHLCGRHDWALPVTEVHKQAACSSTKHHPKLLRFGFLMSDYIVFLSPSLLLTCHLSLLLMSVCLTLEVSLLLLILLFSIC